ncbi:MAG: histidinol dehydrogenase [Rhodobacteraceae bacterium]|nr:histidinol dehydrogenase [Paracoccaceae bacterium]
MAIEYLKTGIDTKTQATIDAEVSATVSRMLDDIARRGEDAVRAYSQRLDHYNPSEFRLSDDAIEKMIATLSDQERHDIIYAQKRVRVFAEAQREALRDIEVEVLPGVVLGHRLVPVQRVGCYVPGGKYPMVAAAHMSVVTAAVAGVPQILAATPPYRGKPFPAVIAAMHYGGAHEVYVVGGVQALGMLALGTASVDQVDMIVGPGNVYVAEAKRQLFGRVGIDLLAGPTETLIIADEVVDAEMCATDLLGQAEHGMNSPAVLVTNSRHLAEETLVEIKRLLTILPTSGLAEASWNDYGQVIVCETYDEMLDVANTLASEHVQVMTARDDWFLDNLTAYGALFLGPRTHVANGDKVIGTNHTLPTRRAGRYTGGLWVGSFLKTHSYQRILTDEAASEISSYCSRLSMLEGFVGHAEQANIRLRRYGRRNIPYGSAAEPVGQ